MENLFHHYASLSAGQNLTVGVCDSLSPETLELCANQTHTISISISILNLFPCYACMLERGSGCHFYPMLGDKEMYCSLVVLCK